jgi:hypothetical protein
MKLKRYIRWNLRKKNPSYHLIISSDIRTFGHIGVNRLRELGDISGFRREVDDK